MFLEDNEVLKIRVLRFADSGRTDGLIPLRGVDFILEATYRGKAFSIAKRMSVGSFKRNPPTGEDLDEFLLALRSSLISYIARSTKQLDGMIESIRHQVKS